MEAPSWLPLDLLLEVLARSDPVTIARGAATCKLLRRHVASTDFRGRLLRRRAGPDRFLAGLFYRLGGLDGDKVLRASPLISSGATPPIPVAPAVTSRTADLFDSHRLAASAGGLLVLTTRREVCVCDVATGERATFPHPGTVAGRLYALLPTPDDGDGAVCRRRLSLSSFLLLAADEVPFRTQTLSPTAGGGGWWGPATVAPDLPLLRRRTERVQPFPVVLGGAAYWLYREHEVMPSRVYHVVVVDTGTGQARGRSPSRQPASASRSLSARAETSSLRPSPANSTWSSLSSRPS
ncbi:unnamed protein product [Urochloa humidicola]